MASLDVTDLIRAGAFLTGSSQSEPALDIAEVLRRRLVQYSQAIGKDDTFEEHSVEELQVQTATESLYILENLQREWSRDDAAPKGPAAIGARDLAQTRTLLSIVFNWGVEPSLGRVVGAIPIAPRTQHTSAKIIDLTGVPDDFARLSQVLLRLLRLPLPNGPQQGLLQTVVTSALLNKHLPDLFKSCIVLGWLPKNLATESVQPVDSIRPYIVHLLSTLPTAHTIAALGGILSDNSISLPYVKKSCGFLLSRQLLRSEGVAGLLAAVFGEEDASEEDAPLEKLEHVGRLLSAVPASMKAEDYYGIIIPRLLAVLSADAQRVPPTYRRAIAFALSRMLASEEGKDTNIISNIFLARLHAPFLESRLNTPPGAEAESTPQKSTTPQETTPSEALRILQTLLTNADPSPNFIDNLLTPIVPPLYGIWTHLEATKTSDPALKESGRGFLVTWGRVVSASEGVAALWQVVLGEGCDWQADAAGNLTRTQTEGRKRAPSLFTPEDLRRAEEAGELDADANLFDLRPDPAQFVRLLRSIERSDISSELFVRLLQAYRERKARSDSDPLRTLLYLQLILQMQNRLAADGSASNILNKPDHILSFIRHALEAATVPPHSASTAAQKLTDMQGLRMEDLRIVEEEEPEIEEGDSDDEGPDSTGSGDDEMVVTAVNLLLSILEAHPDLSARTTPILNDIFSLLEPLSKDASDTIRPLAREARMVMTARLASTSALSDAKKTKKSRDGEETSQETYQKALKFLQDPLLPVRAHGLLLLRNLVSARRTASPTDRGIRLEEPALDRALVPGIMGIFLQSVQDDDSYMYLNAVQGLSAMVDGYGKEVLRGLVKTYSEGIEGVGKGGVMTRQEVDVRTRVGEALGQVVRRCGDVLPAYADILVPPLFQMVRTRDLPTTLRTSAVSLLAQFAKTNALALLSYAADLSEAMVDLLQVETVPAAQRPGTARPERARSSKGNDADETDDRVTGNASSPSSAVPISMDAHPTSIHPKFPPLRRAALHFLGLLIQACTRSLYDAGNGYDIVFPSRLARRARTTLGYVAATDEDGVVRVMAREALEGLEQLSEATVGAALG